MRRSWDPLTTDPSGDTEPHASTDVLTVESGGVELLGVLHLPAGPGPHPIVLLLHGFPGNERNFDLAQVLRRAGYAVLVFHYRGSWGMGGIWSWQNVLADSARAASAVRERAFAAAHRLDPTRLAVVGHSVGGFAALMTAAADSSVRAVGCVTGFDFGSVAVACEADPTLRAAHVRSFDSELLPIRGTSGERLVAEMMAAGASWRLAALADQLADRPVLMIGATRDDVTPLATHYYPAVNAYLAHPVRRLEHHIFATDHALSDHRIALARTVLDFLDRTLDSGQ